MGKDLIKAKAESITPHGVGLVPAAVLSQGLQAAKRFIEFFTAKIRNPNNQRAYLRAVTDFFNWLQKRGVEDVSLVQPVHVAAYVEQLGSTHAALSVKQHLAAVRMRFDWFIVGQVVPTNPASAARGPSHVVKKGKTPVLSSEEARDLLDSIPTNSVVGLRDRALIALIIYPFARVGSATAMRVEDYYTQGRRFWVRLHEKGGKRHDGQPSQSGRVPRCVYRGRDCGG